MPSFGARYVLPTIALQQGISGSSNMSTRRGRPTGRQNSLPTYQQACALLRISKKNVPGSEEENIEQDLYRQMSHLPRQQPTAPCFTEDEGCTSVSSAERCLEPLSSANHIPGKKHRRVRFLRARSRDFTASTSSENQLLSEESPVLLDTPSTGRPPKRKGLLKRLRPKYIFKVCGVVFGVLLIGALLLVFLV
ncbi:uncharacterized protein LOC106159713 [Lingula anatina]|uniref:Uncharacterized protein LOC106159713 n=1 Tax=Lingula anatina TaxID=7574 RepID=A0A1S3HZV8_LINAN|nr:uncharacterized protein LOC106159713 [Lingula anatina]|eukprot:XP_013391548.1 uncharacterized protein LOC106159713 [Lingula anatina]